MNYFFGFTIWKHGFIRPFFKHKPIFVTSLLGKNYLKKALSKGLNPQSTIYIWGRKEFLELEQYARKHSIRLFRVEDGFIRSVGLGSDLTQPYSLIIDSRGIYFDPTQPSDLEDILQNHIFTENEIIRANYIIQYMIDKKLSKYNLYENIDLNMPKDKKIIVVPGQVEDDASVRYGANGMTNLELLKQTRINRPDAYIVYKPHPDVLVGNRVGQVDDSKALQYCDQIITEVGIDSVLQYANEVHTMTSLVGFEALMRNIKVVTYGLPFYAGWGLTESTIACERRTRKLRIGELLIGAYLIYPRYIHPDTLRPCEIEEVLIALDGNRQQINRSFWVKYRNWMSRKLQMMIRIIVSLYKQATETGK